MQILFAGGSGVLYAVKYHLDRKPNVVLVTAGGVTNKILAGRTLVGVESMKKAAATAAMTAKIMKEAIVDIKNNMKVITEGDEPKNWKILLLPKGYNLSDAQIHLLSRLHEKFYSYFKPTGPFDQLKQGALTEDVALEMKLERLGSRNSDRETIFRMYHREYDEIISWLAEQYEKEDKMFLSPGTSLRGPSEVEPKGRSTKGKIMRAWERVSPEDTPSLDDTTLGNFLDSKYGSELPTRAFNATKNYIDLKMTLREYFALPIEVVINAEMKNFGRESFDQMRVYYMERFGWVFDFDRAMLETPKIVSKVNPLADNGGIDLNQIKINRTGKTVTVKFDPAQLSALEQGFEGFTPVITGFEYIKSPFPLLGVNRPSNNPELLAKA